MLEDKKKKLEKLPFQDLMEYEFTNEKVEICVKFKEKAFLKIIKALKDILGSNQIIKIIEEVTYIQFSFNEKIDLSNCHFLEKVKFYDCEFLSEAFFRSCVFHKSIDLSETNFQSKTRFHYSEFKETATFNNTTFSKLVDFYFTTFQKTQSFFHTDFLDVAIFSNTTFTKQVQFRYNKISEKTFISFENATFKQSFDISRANFWCHLQVWGIKTKIVPDEYWLYESDDTAKAELSLSHDSLRRIRESYRRIKQEFRNNDNNIEAQRFQEYEMIVYEKELKIHSEKKIEDRIILWFNKWSNKFGNSWSRGILFTLCITMLFYLIFISLISDELILDFSFCGIGRFIKHFLQFLNITYWDYEPFGVQDYIWAYIFLFVGRIFISYGYYQTIQAFRKYGKN